MSSGPDDPRLTPLREALVAVAASLADFREALHGVNDPELRDAFQPPLELADRLFGERQPGAMTQVADEVANMRSQFARHAVPREHPDFGLLDSFTRLRSVRGSLLADFDAVLQAAADLGLTPTELSFQPPSALEFERAGFDGMLSSLGARLTAVEDALKAVETEGTADDRRSTQQIGLVNFYVENMSIELALAKLEATARAIVDFVGLGRAIEVMGALTRDFTASVRGMASQVTDGLRLAARAMPKLVRRVVSGLRTIVQRVNPSKSQPPSVGEPRLLSDFPQGSHEDDADFWSLIEQGDKQIRLGNLTQATDTYLRASELAEWAFQQDQVDVAWQRNLSVSLDRLGDVERLAGNLSAARGHHEVGLAIAERLAQQEPANAELQRDLSVSFDKLGDVEWSVGNFGAARGRHEAGLAIAERLAQREPANTEWQRDLSISFDKLGDMERSAGDLGAARARYDAGLAIRERLAQHEPANPQWQRDLSVSFNKLGDVERVAGNVGAARARYDAGLAIREKLAQFEPANTEWQRDLSVSFNKLGDVEWSAGNVGAARARYEAGLAIRERLAQREPANTEWQRDLSVSLEKLGDVERTAGNVNAARGHYDASLAISERLAQQEPTNTGWQCDRSISYVKRAQLSEAEGDREGAIQSLEVAERIMTLLAEACPDHPAFARDLAELREDLDRLKAQDV